MARNLRLQVMLNAVDRVTGPLKRMRQGAGQTGQAMRETRDQLKELQRTQSDLTSYRKANAAQRQNIRAMRDARARNHQYTQALEQQREAHANVKSGLTVARREYDRLAKELLKTKQPSDQLTASLERARVRLHGQQTEFDRSARALREYRNRTRHAGEEVKRLTQNHATQTERIRGLKTRLDEAGISTDNLGRSARELRTREERLNTALQEQKRHLSEVAERQRRLTQARDRYQNGMANVARAQGVGMGMFGTGIAQGYAATRVLQPGVSFGESMSAVQALTRLNEDDEAFQALKRQAREKGATTAFSGTQVADAQGFLAMAGFEGDAIETAIPDVLNLALATGADLARTADISSNILSGFGLDPSEMRRVSDVLTATATRANVDLSMLGESMKYVAPQARAMGMSLEQATAMAGLLGDVGIQGSQAGTTLRAMVTRLAAPTGAAAGALDELGVNAKDAQGNLRDIPNILSDVASATETMGNADRAGFLKAIFGEEPGAGMAELIAQQGTAGIEAFVEVLSNSMGEAAQVARVRADNIGGDLKGLRSAWEDVGISITETNKGPIRDLIQNITKVTRSVSAWIEANPELAGTIAKVAAGMIALATVGGAVTMTFASILSPLLFAKFAMATLGIKVGSLGTALGWIAKTAIPWVAGALKGLLVAMGPIGWGIAAIAGAAFLIYKYWEPIKAFFVGLWQQVKAAFDEGVGGVARLLLNWSPYGLLYNAITSTVERLGISIPEGFSNFGSMIVDGIIGGITGKLGELRDSITGMASNAMGWFKDVLDINSPSRVFAEFGGNITQGLSGGIEDDADNPLKQVRGLANNLRNAAGGLMLGAGLATTASAANIDTSAVQIDARPPLQSHASAAPSGGLVIHGGINIEVHAAPGMDEQALARMVNEQVQRALQDAERRAAAASRRNFYDND